MRKALITLIVLLLVCDVIPRGLEAIQQCMTYKCSGDTCGTDAERAVWYAKGGD